MNEESRSAIKNDASTNSRGLTSSDGLSSVRNVGNIPSFRGNPSLRVMRRFSNPVHGDPGEGEDKDQDRTTRHREGKALPYVGDVKPTRESKVDDDV